MSARQRVIGLMSVLVVVSVLYVAGTFSILFLNSIDGGGIFAVPSLRADVVVAWFGLGVPLFAADVILVLAAIGMLVFD